MISFILSILLMAFSVFSFFIFVVVFWRMAKAHQILASTLSYIVEDADYSARTPISKQPPTSNGNMV